MHELDPITPLNTALEGRYEVEREIGESGIGPRRWRRPGGMRLHGHPRLVLV